MDSLTFCFEGDWELGGGGGGFGFFSVSGGILGALGGIFFFGTNMPAGAGRFRGSDMVLAWLGGLGGSSASPTALGSLTDRSGSF